MKFHNNPVPMTTSANHQLLAPPPTYHQPNSHGDEGLLREKKAKVYSYFSLYRKVFVGYGDWIILAFGFIFGLCCGPIAYLMLRELKIVTNHAVWPDNERSDGNGSIPYCLKPQKSYFYPESNHEEPGKEFAIGFGILGLCLIVSSMICYICWDYVGRKQFQKICTLYFGIIDFGKPSTTDGSEFANEISQHLLKTREALGKEIGKFIILFAIGIGCLSKSFQSGPTMSWIAILAALFICAFTYINASLHARYFHRELHYSKVSNDLAEDVIRNIKTVQTYGGEKKEFYQYCKKIDRKGNRGVVRRSFIFGLMNGIMWIIVYGGLSLVFWHGSRRVIHSMFTSCTKMYDIANPGDFVVVLWNLLFGLLNIFLGIPAIEAIFAANQCVQEFFPKIDKKLRSKIIQTRGTIPNRVIKGNIEFNDIFCTYDLANPVLKKINLSIKHGSYIGIIGPANSGKSTLFKLLTKEILPTSGTVSIDGYNVVEMDTDWLRNQIGFVSSDGGLFNRSIEENIRMGRFNCAHHQVLRAAKLAQCHSRISDLRDGFSTGCGPKGSWIEAGLRQQIGIVRALVKEPRILLLDNPTQGLDSISAKWVEHSIKSSMQNKDRSCIIASRNVSSVMGCDMIFVMNDGCIIEQGKHQDLLYKKGFYYQMFLKNSNNPMQNEIQLQMETTSNEFTYKAEIEIMKYFQNIVQYPFRQIIVYHEPSQKLSNIQETKPGNTEDNLSEVIIPGASTAIRMPQPNFGTTNQIPYSYDPEFPTRKRRKSITQLFKIQVQDDLLKLEENTWNKFTKMQKVQPTYNFMHEPQMIQPKSYNIFKTIALASHSPGLAIIGAIVSILIGLLIPVFPIAFGNLIQQFFVSRQNDAASFPILLLYPHLRVSASYSETTNNVENQHNWEADALKFCNSITLFLLITGIIIGFLILIQVWVLRTVGSKSVTHLRKRMLHCMIQQDALWFDDRQNSVQNVMLKLNSDAILVKYVTIIVYGILFQSTSTIASAVLISIFIPKEPIILISILLFLIILVSSFFSGLLNLSAHKYDALEINEIWNLFAETTQNKSTILNCHLEAHFKMMFQQVLLRCNKNSRCTRFLARIFFGLTQGLVFIAYGIIIWFGEHEKIPFYHSIIVAECLFFCFLNVGMQLSILYNFPMIHESSKGILRLFEKKNILRDNFGGMILPDCEGIFEFQNVCFGFQQSSDYVLQNINFTVKPNEFIAIVGTTGAGKTTCLDLSLRFYDPTIGAITLDSIDLRDFKLSNLRSFMGLLESQPKLFKNLTIRQNIAYGDNTRKLSMDEIILAAKQAKIHEFILRLPDGYQTKVSSVFLDTATKHRIALARAIVRPERHILFLDEVLDYLDADSEKAVNESLKEARAGKTCIVFATRLSTITNADKIFFLHQGIIKETGKHDELLSKKGYYYALWNEQHFTGLGIFEKVTQQVVNTIATAATPAGPTKSVQFNLNPTPTVRGPPEAQPPANPVCDVTKICSILGLESRGPNKS